MQVHQAGGDGVTRAQFADTIISLRLAMSEIAKDTGIPRTYLSEFRNGDRKLRPEHLAKLRDYLEEKGVDFGAPDPEDDDEAAAVPHPRLRTTSAPRCYFPLSEEIPDDVIANAISLMEENDARLVVLLKQVAAKNGGFMGDGDLTDEAKAALQEAGSLLAENSVIFRMLRGWRAFSMKPAERAT